MDETISEVAVWLSYSVDSLPTETQSIRLLQIRRRDNHFARYVRRIVSAVASTVMRILHRHTLLSNDGLPAPTTIYNNCSALYISRTRAEDRNSIHCVAASDHSWTHSAEKHGVVMSAS